MNEDPILRDLETAVTYGMGTDEIWNIPGEAVVKLAEGEGHLLAGATFTFWTQDR